MSVIAMWIQACDRLQAENAALRESLRRIVSEHNDNGGCRYSAELGKAIRAGAEVLAEMEMEVD